MQACYYHSAKNTFLPLAGPLFHFGKLFLSKAEAGSFPGNHVYPLGSPCSELRKLNLARPFNPPDKRLMSPRRASFSGSTAAPHHKEKQRRAKNLPGKQTKWQEILKLSLMLICPNKTFPLYFNMHISNVGTSFSGIIIQNKAG